jgi:hypothetical protein
VTPTRGSESAISIAQGDAGGKTGLDTVGDFLDVAGVELARHVLGHLQVTDCKCLQLNRRQQIVAQRSSLDSIITCSFSRRARPCAFITPTGISPE